MRDGRRMHTLMKRLAVSLLAGGIALVATFQIVFRVAWRVILSDAHGDGQSGMGPFFLAVFLAPVVGSLTFALLFRKSRTWM